jgi:molybdenum cofactor cytidylyltransferase
MTHAGTHAAIVLAAGGSVRLGHAKQLLRRDGETLVHRAARLALESGAAPVLVVVGSDAEAVATACADVDALVLRNPMWRSGLATTLQLAVQHLREPAAHVLVLGCDQPALERHHLDALLDGARRSDSDCAATRHDGHLGIPAVVSAAHLQHVHALAGDRGFGAMLSALSCDTVWVLDAPELVFDIDTPENEQAAVARGLLDPTG